MRYLSALIIAIILIVPAWSDSESSTNTVDITGHYLKIQIMPDTQSLSAVDEVTLSDSPNGVFAFTLNTNLVITDVKCNNHEISYETGPYEGAEAGETGWTYRFMTVKVNLPDGATKFTIAYEGEISDPIESGKTLIHVRGDQTSGIISSDGVFLCSSSGWYPDTANAMATFHIESSVPKTWYSVTQGDLLKREIVGDERTSEWKCDIMFDSCVLVASEYYKRTRKIAGVDCSTYFYEDNEALSDSFLDKLEEYLPAYIELFGEYKYSRFDVVENFFTTGYGMPGFTLLGKRVIRMPFATLQGSLGHELVHCWWGNYVVPDWNQGNWCEGITYNSTNYYWSIIKGLDEEAREFRYTDMLKYTLQVVKEDEYPVRKFRSKFTETDGNIGYGKASAIFRMLQQMLGDELYFKALKKIVVKHGAKLSTWDDFREVFEEVSGKDLKQYFHTWLDYTGTPKLKCDSIGQYSGSDGNHIKFNIVQDGDLYHLVVPFLISTPEGDIKDVVEIKEKSTGFDYLIPAKVTSIELDPDYYVFRELVGREIAPCLNTTIKSEQILIILPSGGEDDLIEIFAGHGHGRSSGGTKSTNVKKMYEELAESMIESGIKAEIKRDYQVTDDDLKSSSIICLGASRYNSVAKKIADQTDGAVYLNHDRFELDGNECLGAGASALVTVRNPFNEDNFVTFYFGNSPQAVSKASLIFHYRLHSYVIYEDGNAIDKKKWAIENSLVYKLG
ncbi:hypothetical protein J7L05_11090 [bacterium]|nr:hypothetical protein [bacterium]